MINCYNAGKLSNEDEYSKYYRITQYTYGICVNTVAKPVNCFYLNNSAKTDMRQNFKNYWSEVEAKKVSCI